ncbi:MAG: energy transducer TonB [Bacteroidota bacterium]
MKAFFTILLLFLSAHTSIAQDDVLIKQKYTMPPPQAEFAEGCEDAENRLDCSDEKLRNVTFEALTVSDIEKIMQQTEKDTIFIDTKLFFDKNKQLDLEKSFVRFHETELKFFEGDLSFSLNDLPFKPSPKVKRNAPIFHSFQFVKIDRNHKKLIPLPEYKPERIPFSGPEKYIVYPGCEDKTTNKDLRRCMSQSISKYVGENFDTDSFSKLNLEGIQQIYVIFMVEKDGSVSIKKSRASHPALAAEAERVVKMLPKMKPGEIENTPVGIQYTLPIAFKVD